eukprot:TRINITY_DN8341_c0_g2_i1.p1 TRINITY_DN8341_c0_g2~~TRINITY_DN8341_c0_g2_i1.p1  ORF type:complete len:816 (+),score=168.40 TRINITY_DN8341_c0_g2_i1:22-2448(+)
MASDISRTSLCARDELIEKLSEADLSAKGSDRSQSVHSEPRDNLQKKEDAELQVQTPRSEEEKGRGSGSSVGSHRGSSCSQRDHCQGGGSQRGMTKEGMLNKISSLQAALLERDTQQQTLLQKLSTLQSQRESDEAQHRLQMKNAEQAARSAASDRDALVDEMAGGKTRFHMKLEYQIAKHEANLQIREELEASANTRLSEMESMQTLIEEMRKEAKDNKDHQEQIQACHDLRVAELQSVIAGLMNELHDQQNADSTTVRGELTEKRRMQEEMITLQLKQQQQTLEMRRMRLTMLSLEKDTAEQRHGRSRAAASALGSIVEEEDLENMQSTGISVAASDCTDSEVGVEILPKQNGESALLEELRSQRAASQSMKEDLMADHSQQASRIVRLLQQVAQARQETSNMEGTIAHMTADADKKATKHAFDLDEVQLKLREAKLFCSDQEQELQKQLDIQVERDEWVGELEGELQMAREGLRISLLRLEDTQQALHRAEQSLPKQTRTLTNTSEEDDDNDLPTLLVQLRQEKNQLTNRLEATDVTHRIAIEELKQKHDADMMSIGDRHLLSGHEALCGSDSSQITKPEGSTSALGSLGWASTISCSYRVALANAGQKIERQPAAASTSCFHAISMALGLGQSTPADASSTHAMCWELVSVAPSSVAFFCLPEGLRVMKLSKMADVRFGERLCSRSLLTLFPLGQRQFMLRALADQLASSAEQIAFSVRNIGVFDVEDAHRARFDVTVACLPPETGENEMSHRALIIMFSEQVRAPRSSQSCCSADSEVAPSDSVSQLGLGRSRRRQRRAHLRT